MSHAPRAIGSPTPARRKTDAWADTQTLLTPQDNADKIANCQASALFWLIVGFGLAALSCVIWFIAANWSGAA